MSVIIWPRGKSEFESKFVSCVHSWLLLFVLLAQRPGRVALEIVCSPPKRKLQVKKSKLAMM